MINIPKADYGLIGGSGTWASRFPEDYNFADVKLLKRYNSFETPYGESASFKLLQVNGKNTLRVATHGWTTDLRGRPLPNWICSQQVAWIFQKAGVKYVLGDGSVGGIKSPDNSNEALTPWSVLVTNDFIMHWFPATRPIFSPRKPSVRMREPFCQAMREYLYKNALKEKCFKVFNDGIYICTSVDRFETEAEINMMAQWGAHMVGQTLGHEAPLLRNIGIHFAILNIVANVAEGHVNWVGTNNQSMSKFYKDCAKPMGRVIMDTLKDIINKGVKHCNCENYILTGLNEFPVKDA